MTGAGLCGSCRHGRRMVSDRGSVFLRCERARKDPAYPKYPPLPVWNCVGYEEALRAGAERAPEALGNDPLD